MWETVEPEFSLLLLIVLHALLPKGSNNTNVLHAQCLSVSLSFCLSFTFPVTLFHSPLPPSPVYLHWLVLSALCLWVLCEGSCKSKGHQHALTNHLSGGGVSATLSNCVLTERPTYCSLWFLHKMINEKEWRIYFSKLCLFICLLSNNSSFLLRNWVWASIQITLGWLLLWL